MQVTCPCGKLLKVPDTAVGKRVKCPACGKVFQVPAEPDDSAPAPAAIDKIIVECSCGKKLAAPASAAGKQVRCPACKSLIPVPGGEEADDGSPGFSLETGSEESDGGEYGVENAKCPACGEILAPGAQFCVACGTHISTGTRVDGVDMNAIAQKKSDAKKTRLAIIVIIVVAALIIAGTVIALWPEIQTQVENLFGEDNPATSRPAPSSGGDSESPAPADEPASDSGT